MLSLTFLQASAPNNSSWQSARFRGGKMRGKWTQEQLSTAAAHIADLKQVPFDRKDVVREAYLRAVSRVYRAIALDIDGTLTATVSGHAGEADLPPLSPLVTRLVSQLLKRGVPIILITGRGSTARHSAAQIRDASNLSSWQTRRLFCATHNGVTFLRTPSADPDRFLGEKVHLAPWDRVDRFAGHLQRQFGQHQAANLGDYLFNVKDHSIRITTKNPKTHGLLLKLVETARQAFARDNSHETPIYIATGVYGSETLSIDITKTNKAKAIEDIAKLLFIDPERILRIGDQGHVSGNDYDLLNSNSGFSVRRFSAETQSCFPVVQLRTNGSPRVLRGHEATSDLISRLNILPDLCITPADGDAQRRYLSELRKFEELASLRSRKETDATLRHIQLRLRHLIDDERSAAAIEQLRLEDLYDLRSGAVRLRDWEFSQLEVIDEYRRLYPREELGTGKDGDLQMLRSLYSDSSILLRGALYYVSFFSEQIPDRPCGDYVYAANSYLADAQHLIAVARESAPTLPLFKVALSILDNLRQISLTYFTIIAQLTFSEKISAGRLQTVYSEMVLPTTKLHYDFLYGIFFDWRESMDRLTELTRRLQAGSRSYGKEFADLADEAISEVELSDRKEQFKAFFRWREADFFIQNVAAVQLAIHEFRQRSDKDGIESFTAVGMAFGAIELPAIAQVIGEARHVKVLPALMHVSLYTDDALRKQHDADPEAALGVLQKRPLHFLDRSVRRKDAPRRCVILDDNTTTGRTIQVARDGLEARGLSVIGVVLVRFPSSNRFVQMMLRGHGAAHPDVLFSFIRGLVAPSPYARLLSSDGGYTDRIGSFDKAKERVSQALIKNRFRVWHPKPAATSA
jgi:hydroxymethylpyrimidine pyrophosphatase-like HAD family hydrolase/pyrimidine operon attenuation protein/uracil phosphoribosyltransferase